MEASPSTAYRGLVHTFLRAPRTQHYLSDCCFPSSHLPLVPSPARAAPKAAPVFNKSSTGDAVANAYLSAIPSKFYFVTGGTAGLGLETVAVLAARGANVIFTGRSQKTIDEAMTQLTAKLAASKAAVPAVLKGMACDLSSLKSVQACAEQLLADASVPHIDCLIENAGVMACPLSYTAEGWEQQFGVNHMGHFYLTLLLLPKVLQAPGQPRILVLSSVAQYAFAPKEGLNLATIAKTEAKDYCPWKAYGSSKMANVLFARELQKRLDAGQLGGNAGKKVHVVSLHPGNIMETKLSRHLGGYAMYRMLTYPKVYCGLGAMKNTQQGIATTIYCALAPEAELQRGAFYSDCALGDAILHPHGRDDALAEGLWKLSEQLLQEKGFSVQALAGGSGSGSGASAAAAAGAAAAAETTPQAAVAVAVVASPEGTGILAATSTASAAGAPAAAEAV